MTSCAPWTEQVLAALHTAAPGSYAARTPAERYDLEATRQMSVSERLIRLDEILRFAEAHRMVEVSNQRIRHGELRL